MSAPTTSDCNEDAARAHGSSLSVWLDRSFHAVMDYAARNNWSEQLLDVSQKKFGRVRQGVGVLRESYRSMLAAQSNYYYSTSEHIMNLPSC